MNESIAADVLTNAITAAFIAAMILIFAYAFINRNDASKQHFIQFAPSLLTSLGLFGTFLGIFLGLLQFDPKQIDGSIQNLLAGLQTAFITSLAGMLTANLLKYFHTKNLDARNGTDVAVQINDVEPKDIYKALLAQNEELKIIANGIGRTDDESLAKQFKLLHIEAAAIKKSLSEDIAITHRESAELQQKRLENILTEARNVAESISGDSDKSVKSLLQGFRNDTVVFASELANRHENFEQKLWKHLDQFAEVMSKAATEQVVEALRKVIQDFNNKLSEQFGANFQRLESAVGNLVDWQDKYKQQLEEMMRVYALGVESIESTNKAVESIRNSTNEIPETMTHLEEVLKFNKIQIEELNRHLDAFVQMRTQAIQAIPQIQHRLNTLGEELTTSAEKFSSSLLDGIKTFEQSTIQTNGSLIKLANNIATQADTAAQETSTVLQNMVTSSETIRSGLKNAVEVSLAGIEAASNSLHAKSRETTTLMQQSIKQVIDTAIENSSKAHAEAQRTMDAANLSMVQSADRSLKSIERQIQEAVGRTNEAVNAQLKLLDQALETQLNAALQELGTSLASIAGHLMETYQNGTGRGPGNS